MSTQSPGRRPPRTVARQLAQLYERSGYGRVQDERRYAKEGPKRYKKGEEIRLVAFSREELRLMQDLLARAGFKAGRPFPKYSRWVLPVYGKAQVASFLELVAAQGVERVSSAHRRRRF